MESWVVSSTFLHVMLASKNCQVIDVTGEEFGLSGWKENMLAHDFYLIWSAASWLTYVFYYWSNHSAKSRVVLQGRKCWEEKKVHIWALWWSHHLFSWCCSIRKPNLGFGFGFVMFLWRVEKTPRDNFKRTRNTLLPTPPIHPQITPPTFYDIWNPTTGAAFLWLHFFCLLLDSSSERWY